MNTDTLWVTDMCLLVRYVLNVCNALWSVKQQTLLATETKSGSAEEFTWCKSLYVTPGRDCSDSVFQMCVRATVDTVQTLTSCICETSSDSILRLCWCFCCSCLRASRYTWDREREARMTNTETPRQIYINISDISLKKQNTTHTLITSTCSSLYLTGSGFRDVLSAAGCTSA